VRESSLLADKGGEDAVSFAEKRVMELAGVARVCWALALAAGDLDAVAPVPRRGAGRPREHRPRAPREACAHAGRKVNADAQVRRLELFSP
jgi:hypothetical protein